VLLAVLCDAEGVRDLAAGGEGVDVDDRADQIPSTTAIAVTPSNASVCFFILSVLFEWILIHTVSYGSRTVP
jgi:hypothetical protein